MFVLTRKSSVVICQVLLIERFATNLNHSTKLKREGGGQGGGGGVEQCHFSGADSRFLQHELHSHRTRKYEVMTRGETDRSSTNSEIYRVFREHIKENIKKLHSSLHYTWHVTPQKLHFKHHTWLRDRIPSFRVLRSGSSSHLTEHNTSRHSGKGFPPLKKPRTIPVMLRNEAILSVVYVVAHTCRSCAHISKRHCSAQPRKLRRGTRCRSYWAPRAG